MFRAHSSCTQGVSVQSLTLSTYLQDGLSNPWMQHQMGSVVHPLSAPLPQTAGQLNALTCQRFDSQAEVPPVWFDGTSEAASCTLRHQWAGASLTGYRYPQVLHP